MERKPFRALDDAALLHRIDRLERAEQDLQQTMLTRVSQVEAEGRWPRSDPQCAHLSLALRNVRRELREIEDEYLGRGALALARVA